MSVYVLSVVLTGRDQSMFQSKYLMSKKIIADSQQEAKELFSKYAEDEGYYLKGAKSKIIITEITLEDFKEKSQNTSDKFRLKIVKDRVMMFRDNIDDGANYEKDFFIRLWKEGNINKENIDTDDETTVAVLISLNLIKYEL